MSDSSKKTTIYSIQPVSVFEKIQECGFYRPVKERVFLPDMEWCDWAWQNAYSWMREMLTLKTGTGPLFENHYPVWGWVSSIEQPFNTDTRKSLFRSWGGRAEEYALMELHLPADAHLPSDYDYWHSALNYWYLARSEVDADSFDNKCETLGVKKYSSNRPYAPLLDEEIKKSWEQIFSNADLDKLAAAWGDSREVPTWQTVFWEIRKEHLRSVKFFKPNRVLR